MRKINRKKKRSKDINRDCKTVCEKEKDIERERKRVREGGTFIPNSRKTREIENFKISITKAKKQIFSL